MHDWCTFRDAHTTVALEANTSPEDAKCELYKIPRGVSFAHSAVMPNDAWVQHGAKFVCLFPLDRNQFDVISDVCVHVPEGGNVTLVSETPVTECDLPAQLTLLLVSALFTSFAVKVSCDSKPDKPVTITFTATLYDFSTRNKLSLQSWKTQTHTYANGRAQLKTKLE